MRSICILLTDFNGINEKIIIKSKNYLKNLKIKKIYFIGDKKKFKNIFSIFSKEKKFEFLDIRFKSNYYLYLNDILKVTLNLHRKKFIKSFINMPINKKRFFNNRFNGFTEYFSEKFYKKKAVNMLMYNEIFSVCPLTTHVQLKEVYSKINKKILIKCIENLTFFYEKIIKKKMKIIVLGINPHASKDLLTKSKDNTIISPVVKYFKKKGVEIDGPISADTSFSSTKNKVYIGMYHDQVLIPFKLKNKFNGINITIGKELLRVSPDHGTGENIKFNRLISNKSFLKCIKFCAKYA